DISAPDDSRISSSGSLVANQWVHVVHTWETTTDTHFLYINGQLEATTVVAGKNPVGQANVSFSIGSLSSDICNGPDNFFNGSIDDVRIYDRALSANEVSALYNLENTPPPNSAPVITSYDGNATVALSVQENQAFAADVNASDTDGDDVNYSISGGTDASKFDLNGTTGVLTFKTAPDYEANASAAGNNAYAVIVNASDGEANATQNLTVNVTSAKWLRTITGLSGAHRIAIDAGKDSSVVVVGGHSSGGFARSINSQNFNTQWDFLVNTSTQTWVQGVSSDPSGNVYLSGHLGASDNFGGISVPFQYERDPWVGKVDSAGNWQWVKSVGTGAWSGADSMATDAAGNSYVTGSIYGSATFGSTTVGGAGWYDAFLAKIDSSGNWVWAKSVGGSSGDFGRDVILDDDGNLYWVGDFVGSVTIGGTNLSSSGGGNLNGGGEVFVTKLDSSGNFLWALKGGSANENETYEGPTSIATDKDGNAYVVGSVAGAATFGSTSLTAAGSTDAFVAKASSDGQWLWAKSLAGSGVDRSTGIVRLPDGDFYVSGYFSGSAQVDGQTLVASGATDSFVLKFDPDGNLVSHSTIAGLTINSIDQNEKEETFIGGTFSGTLDYFGATHQAVGASNVFVALFDEGPGVANAPPVITSYDGNATVTVNALENQSFAADVTASDTDGNETVSYTISGGTDAGKFDVNATTGMITFKTNPDFEIPTDLGTNNTYEVTVMASDGEAHATQAVTVNVTD
ncbi:MAG: LamG-like jellyroll fold domain-containing protein, partial [Opitutales bacterium]